MRFDVDPAVVARLGALCLALPETVEETAWTGQRWRIRGKTFAHVLAIVDGRPAGYARAAGLDGPVVVITFRITAADRDLFVRLGLPHFAVRWGHEVGGLVLGDAPDWDEIAELVTDSYCLLAPARLAAQVPRPDLPDTISTPD